MRTLCRVEDIADGATRGFGPAPGGFTGLFAVRLGTQVAVYVNSCPHLGLSLDWAPDRFLTTDGTQIVCSSHGALFDLRNGRCTAGPCEGESLTAVPVVIRDGHVLVPEDAGL